MTADRPRPPATDRPTDPGELADRVRSAVLAVPGVLDLTKGLAGEVATYLPGRSVPGVRLLDERAEVHVAVAHGVDIPALGEKVRNAVRQVVPSRVDVHVDDVREPLPALPPGPPSTFTPVSD